MTDATARPPVNFTTVERVIMDRLRRDGGGRDVAVRVLFAAAFGTSYKDMPRHREQQMRLGARISPLNKKLWPDERVVPGRLKQTYRLERFTPQDPAPAAE